MLTTWRLLHKALHKQASLRADFTHIVQRGLRLGAGPKCTGKAECSAVEAPLRIPASHLRVLVQVLAPLPVQLPANIHPGMVQVLASLPHKWEMRLGSELTVPAWPSPGCSNSGMKQRMEDLFLCLSVIQ